MICQIGKKIIISYRKFYISKTGFVFALTLGLYGWVFVDFGNDFIVEDTNGEENEEIFIDHIQNSTEPIVKIVNWQKHKFNDRSLVKFKNVEGMTEINTTDPIAISVIDGYSFKLKLDTTSFSEYTREGIVSEVKVPKKHKFNSLRQALIKPLESSPDQCFITPDLGFFDRPGVLHIAMQGVLRFHLTHGRLPSNTEEDVKACLDLSKTINDELKSTEGAWAIDELDTAVFSNVSRFASASLSPVAAFFGGVVAQEVVKFTGKYTPITQWLHLDFFKSLPTADVTREAKQSRYDDQIMIFGSEFQEKLLKQRLFLVGAGALGCEFIKQFALMGIGCSADGLISCTDNDNIEVSNLNRQFLFRKGDVGSSKSETACRIGGEMNPDFNVRSYQTLVGEQTESVFNDTFWDNLDFVVNAVDNIKARLYVDSRWVWYKKALLESGTLGTKANSQMIIPHLTQSYSDSNDYAEEHTPYQIIDYYPFKISHTIEFGKKQFDSIFIQRWIFFIFS